MDNFEKGRVIGKSAGLFRWTLILFFLFPFLWLLRLSGADVQMPDWGEFLWALKNTLLQSFLSAGLSLIIAIPFALGLRWLNDRRGPVIAISVRALLLLPAALPSLFVLLVGFKLISPFPRGAWGTALMHVLAGVGLCAILIESVLSEKLARLSEAAWILGASKILFWRRSIRSVTTDFATVFLFVFVFCFSSFAIPLMIGGSTGTTIEVLIYEKIRISASWGQAVLLSLIQAVFLFLLSFLPFRSSAKLVSRTGSALVRSRLGGVLALIYALAFAFAFFLSGFSGWKHVFQIQGLWQQAVEKIPVTAILGIFAWLLFYLLLKAISFFWMDRRIAKFLRGYVAPSVALVGLVGVSLTGWTDLPGPRQWIIYLGAMLILYFPALFRMRWSEQLGSFSGQAQAAQVLGASQRLIFSRVIWPQLRTTAFTVALIGALWVMGDFALAKILFAQPVTLSLLIESLLSSYRLEAALALTQLWIGLAIFVGVFLWGGHRVYRTKS